MNSLKFPIPKTLGNRNMNIWTHIESSKSYFNLTYICSILFLITHYHQYFTIPINSLLPHELFISSSSLPNLGFPSRPSLLSSQRLNLKLIFSKDLLNSERHSLHSHLNATFQTNYSYVGQVHAFLSVIITLR